jgi:hypothetical protein
LQGFISGNIGVRAGDIADTAQVLGGVVYNTVMSRKTSSVTDEELRFILEYELAERR